MHMLCDNPICVCYCWWFRNSKKAPDMCETPLIMGYLNTIYGATTIGFPTKNDHFGVFWGYHHLRKHPYQLVSRIFAINSITLQETKNSPLKSCRFSIGKDRLPITMAFRGELLNFMGVLISYLEVQLTNKATLSLIPKIATGYVWNKVHSKSNVGIYLAFSLERGLLLVPQTRFSDSVVKNGHFAIPIFRKDTPKPQKKQPGLFPQTKTQLFKKGKQTDPKITNPPKNLFTLLMAEILHHLGCINFVNDGINYLSTGAWFQPSTALRLRQKCFQVQNALLQNWIWLIWWTKSIEVKTTYCYHLYLPNTYLPEHRIFTCPPREHYPRKYGSWKIK